AQDSTRVPCSLLSDAAKPRGIPAKSTIIAAKARALSRSNARRRRLIVGVANTGARKETFFTVDLLWFLARRETILRMCHAIPGGKYFRRVSINSDVHLNGIRRMPAMFVRA